MSTVFCRKKKTNAYRIKRKWMKDKDRYAMTKTGEEPMNPWITKTRVMIFMKEMERMRNLNRHNTKYNEKLINTFADATEKYNEFAMYRFFGHHREYIENLDCMNQAKAEAATLPKYLQEDLKANQEDYELPNELDFFDKYYPQIVRVLPQKMAETWMIMNSCSKYLDKDEEDESKPKRSKDDDDEDDDYDQDSEDSDD